MSKNSRLQKNDLMGGGGRAEGEAKVAGIECESNLRGEVEGNGPVGLPGSCCWGGLERRNRSRKEIARRTRLE